MTGRHLATLKRRAGRGATTAALALALGLCGGAAAAQSAYDCRGLASDDVEASLEGLDGVFYRIIPDLQEGHRLTPETVSDLARFSRALAAGGTELIFLPIPTKALALPDRLPAEAMYLGYDAELAASVHGETLKALRKAGVRAADARRALRNATGSGELPVFATDPRPSATGSRALAEAVAEAMHAAPSYDALPKSGFATRQTGTETLSSVTRFRLQRHCQAQIPPVRTARFATERKQAALVSGGGELFGGASPVAAGARVAVVGTEMTGTAATNFAGFLAEASGLEVVQYAVPQGGPFAAVSTYLTSRQFAESRPDFLVWEVPVWQSLASHGDQPMAELIAAATGDCRAPLQLVPGTDPSRLYAELGAVDPGRGYTLFLDTGASEAMRAAFRFASRDGRVRERTIVRNPAQAATGRFYMPLTGLWPDGIAAVEIETDTPFGSSPRLAACLTEESQR